PAPFGLVENQYGVIGLVRASLAVSALASEADADPDWSLFARLALAGARIVSIPIPLSTHSGAIGKVGDVPGAGFGVSEAFEDVKAMPLADMPQLAATLAAALQHSSSADPAARPSRRGERLLRRAARTVKR